jgi:hypothetical protein
MKFFIRAELVDSDTAIAAGISVTAYAPVLELCRRLIAAGHDPTARLEAYRGPILCLIVRSIGEAADLDVRSGAVGFKRHRGWRAAPPMRHEAHPNREARP